MVCSGDFIKEDENDNFLWEEVVNDYYLISLGTLLKYFIVFESIFFVCCVCSGTIWTLITSDPMGRLSTPVEYTMVEQQKILVDERVALKKQMMLNSRIVLEREQKAKQRRLR